MIFSYLPVQRRLWNIISWNTPADSDQEIGRSSQRFDNSVDVLTALDALFGLEGTQEFLKDNLFEVMIKYDNSWL